jgi:hypothetical protein
MMKWVDSFIKRYEPGTNTYTLIMFCSIRYVSVLRSKIKLIVLCSLFLTWFCFSQFEELRRGLIGQGFHVDPVPGVYIRVSDHMAVPVPGSCYAPATEMILFAWKTTGDMPLDGKWPSTNFSIHEDRKNVFTFFDPKSPLKDVLQAALPGTEINFPISLNLCH